MKYITNLKVITKTYSGTPQILRVLCNTSQLHPRCYRVLHLYLNNIIILSKTTVQYPIYIIQYRDNTQLKKVLLVRHSHDIQCCTKAFLFEI